MIEGATWTVEETALDAASRDVSATADADEGDATTGDELVETISDAVEAMTAETDAGLDGDTVELADETETVKGVSSGIPSRVATGSKIPAHQHHLPVVPTVTVDINLYDLSLPPFPCPPVMPGCSESCVSISGRDELNKGETDKEQYKQTAWGSRLCSSMSHPWLLI